MSVDDRSHQFEVETRGNSTVMSSLTNFPPKSRRSETVTSERQIGGPNSDILMNTTPTTLMQGAAVEDNSVEVENFSHFSSSQSLMPTTSGFGLTGLTSNHGYSTLAGFSPYGFERSGSLGPMLLPQQHSSCHNVPYIPYLEGRSDSIPVTSDIQLSTSEESSPQEWKDMIIKHLFGFVDPSKEPTISTVYAKLQEQSLARSHLAEEIAYLNARSNELDVVRKDKTLLSVQLGGQVGYNQRLSAYINELQQKLEEMESSLTRQKCSTHDSSIQVNFPVEVVHESLNTSKVDDLTRKLENMEKENADLKEALQHLESEKNGLEIRNRNLLESEHSAKSAVYGIVRDAATFSDKLSSFFSLCEEHQAGNNGVAPQSEMSSSLNVSDSHDVSCAITPCTNGTSQVPNIPGSGSIVATMSPENLDDFISASIQGTPAASGKRKRGRPKISKSNESGKCELEKQNATNSRRKKQRTEV